jgi:glucosamine kinase
VRNIFIGVDGGATKCVVRVEDENGQLLGEAKGGPASIRLSVPQAIASLYNTLQPILASHHLSLDDPHNHFHAGVGLAGCEIKAAYDAFLHHPHLFKTLTVVSDAHAACVGAHGGQDGAIIIAGTGSVGFQIEAGATVKVGGWGFPHDDRGGAAWLGVEAVRLTLGWLDGRLSACGLVKAVHSYFHHDQKRLVDWANEATPTAFAELAPIVVFHAKNNDSVAIQLLTQVASDIECTSAALLAKQQQNSPLPVVLVGGIASFIKPYLGEALSARLRDHVASPAQGALSLVRNVR